MSRKFTQPLREKLSLWRSLGKGATARLSSRTKEPANSRNDINNLILKTKLDRGDRLQKLRLKFYSTIDVDHDKLFAGKIKGSLDDAEDKLEDIGARNNPTAYVEVTDQYGPDDGSYSIQIISETGGNIDRPVLTGHPTFYRRIKDQIHIVLFDIDDEVHFLTHREKSAWLQPTRHIITNDASAREGVVDFRERWFREFGEEMPGKEKVKWDVTV